MKRKSKDCLYILYRRGHSVSILRGGDLLWCRSSHVWVRTFPRVAEGGSTLPFSLVGVSLLWGSLIRPDGCIEISVQRWNLSRWPACILSHELTCRPCDACGKTRDERRDERRETRDERRETRDDACPNSTGLFRRAVLSAHTSTLGSLETDPQKFQTMVHRASEYRKYDDHAHTMDIPIVPMYIGTRYVGTRDTAVSSPWASRGSDRFNIGNNPRGSVGQSRRSMKLRSAVNKTSVRVPHLSSLLNVRAS